MRPMLVILGTRPEAIKLAPLILALRERGRQTVAVCSTGQHRAMLRGAMRAFSLTPDADLDLLREGEGSAALLGRMLAGLDDVIGELCPSRVLVQGDTLSAYAGALSAFYRRVPVAHLEAGLRTYHMDSPFPEEMHRTSISLLADLHFAPTAEAKENLLREGRREKSVFVTGNTVVDALRYTLRLPAPPLLRELPTDRRWILFTAHRRENLGRSMEGMFRALRRIVEAHPDVLAICPIHPNPRVREAAKLLEGCERIRVIEPPDVVTFHHLLSRAYLVMTDSGGVQEEATCLGVPTMVMRYATERQEGIRSGVLRLSGSGEEGIVTLAERLLAPSSEEYEKMKTPSAVFGDGRASARIAKILERG